MQFPVDAVRCLLPLALSLGLGLPVPGPSISVSPSGVIAPGGAVTIRCQCQCEARRLFLYKDGIKIWELDAAGDGGEFTIPSARQADGGVYTCQSRSRSEPPNWSDPSDIMQIIVVDEGYPKPSISLRPSGRVALGGAVTVRCRGRYQNMKFLLYKDGNPNALQDMEPAGDLAEFPIRNVSWRDAGSYSCYYHHKWYPFIWSRPSDPVELVVAGELPGSVSPLPAPHPAGPSGQGHVQGRKILFYKDGDSDYLAHTDPAGSEAEFPITSAGREHGGSYTCRYSYRTERAAYSEPSDLVQIIVAGQGPSPASRLPAPHPARPQGVTVSPGTQQMGRPASEGCACVWGKSWPPGGGCVGSREISGDALGALDPRGDPDPVSVPSLTLYAGDGAQWPCRGLSHAPSPATAELNSPKPSISLSPSGGGGSPWGSRDRPVSGSAPGSGVCSVQGWGRNAAVRGRDSAGVKFPIPKVSWSDGGSNTCYYPPTRILTAGRSPATPWSWWEQVRGPARRPRSQPHPQPDTQGGSAPMGHSEPGSSLSPGPSRGDTQQEPEVGRFRAGPAP
uniref:Ig-like domain-containing protein n=1 Tax=Terrapene triunguis TaxID=2587831 RepID=A0A674JUS4_9SAUR